MPNASWRIAGLSLVLVGVIAWLYARDDGDEAPPGAGAGASAAGDAKAAAEAGAVAGDPLLQRAREGIRAGSLPEGLRAEMLGSTAPEHARAQRVLLAMDEPQPGAGERAEADDGAEETDIGDSASPPPWLYW